MEKDKKNKTHIGRTLMMCLIIASFILPLIPISVNTIADSTTYVHDYTPLDNSYRDISDQFVTTSTGVSSIDYITDAEVYYEVGIYYCYSVLFKDGDWRDIVIQKAGDDAYTLTTQDTYNNVRVSCFQILSAGTYALTTTGTALSKHYRFYGASVSLTTRLLHPMEYPYYAYCNSTIDEVKYVHDIYFYKMSTTADFFISNLTNRITEMLPHSYNTFLQGPDSIVNYTTNWTYRHCRGGIYQFIAFDSTFEYIIFTVDDLSIEPIYITSWNYYNIYAYPLGYLEGDPQYYNELTRINYTINNTNTGSNLYFLEFSIAYTNSFYFEHVREYNYSLSDSSYGDIVGYSSWVSIGYIPPVFISNECELVTSVAYDDIIFGIVPDKFSRCYYVQTRNKLYRVHTSSDAFFSYYDSPVTTTRDNNIMYTWDNVIWYGAADRVYMIFPDFSQTGSCDVAVSTNAMPFVHYPNFVSTLYDRYYIYSQTEQKLMRLDYEGLTREWIWINMPIFGVGGLGYWQYTNMITVYVDWTNDDASNPTYIDDITSNFNYIYISGSTAEPVEKQKIYYYSKDDGSKIGEINMQAECIFCVENNTMLAGNSTGLYNINLTDGSIISNNSALAGAKQIISDFKGYSYVSTWDGNIYKIYTNNLSIYKKFNYDFEGYGGYIHDICLSTDKNYVYVGYKNYLLKFQNYYDEEDYFIYDYPIDYPDIDGPGPYDPDYIPSTGLLNDRLIILGNWLGISMTGAGLLLTSIIVLIFIVIGLILGARSGLLYVLLGLCGIIFSYAMGFAPFWIIFLFGIIGAGLLVWGGMNEK